jgi:hypothetical protein
MNWEMIKENLSAFFNMPVVVSVMSVTFGFIYLLVIFSKTSLGKKLFNKVKSKYEEVVSKAGKMSEELAKFKKEKDGQLKEIKDEYEKRLALALSEEEELENCLKTIAETTANKKVKEGIYEFLSHKEERHARYAELIATYADFEKLQTKAKEEAEKAKETATSLLEQEKALYEAKKEELDQIIADFKERAENALKGEEDGTDTDKAEEAL